MLKLDNVVLAPRYSDHIRTRIANARNSARRSARRAWLVGTHPPTGSVLYLVISSTDGKHYYPKVHDNGTWGGYCYSVGAQPIKWIRCTCEAAERLIPCRHAARVQLRLEREVGK